MHLPLLLFTIFIWCTCVNSQSYCVLGVGPSTTLDSNLGAVYLYGNTKNIVELSDCPGFQGVHEFLNLVADVTMGKTYNLTFTPSTCGGNYPTLSTAWIDWNQDSQWTPNEQLGEFTSNKGPIPYQFTVPQGAKFGTTRMRVQVQETYQAFIDPCSAFNYGATKDFSISVGGSCPSGPATTLDMNLGPVTLKGDTRAIEDDSNCPGSVGPVDLRNQWADLVRNFPYSISWQVTTCGDTWPTLSGAWADYDQNGLFTKDELLGSLTSQQGLITQNFVVPEGTYFGNITLRVQVQETFSFDMDPCSDFAYGGTKDFLISLKNSSTSTYCRSGPTSLGLVAVGPVGLPGETQVITNNDVCPGVLGPQDLTSEVADLKIASAYTLSYSVLNCTASRPNVLSAAWIDFNQDLNFENWEQIVVETPAYGDLSQKFKVPVSTVTNEVKTGRTRLRVQVQEKSTPGLVACDQFSVGGTKDFSVTIIA